MLDQLIISALETRCHVPPSQKLLLGFSGGPDSVCLLDVLSKSSQTLAIAYFDHQLRSQSNQELEFSRQTAQKYKTPFFSGSADIAELAGREGIGVEACARKYRYRFLAEKAREFGADAIVVAHHADDQVETVIMNIIRGCGVNGLAGMPYSGAHEFTGDIQLARPMLDVWKDDILVYCAAHRLAYRIDQTNFAEDYTRNKLRNRIIPLLEEINPGAKENIARMRSIAADENTYLDDLACKAYVDVTESAGDGLVVFRLEQFTQHPKNIQRRIIIKTLQEAFAINKDMRYQMVEDIRDLFTFSLKTNQLQINDQIHCLVEGDVGYVYEDARKLPHDDAFFLEKSDDLLFLPVPGSIRMNSSWQLTADIPDEIDPGTTFYAEASQFTALLDADQVDGSLFIRRKKPGDRYAPMGMDRHSMKVSDFWINKKVPKRIRHGWPLICDTTRIVWIPGFQPASAVCITPATRRALKLSVEKIEA